MRVKEAHIVDVISVMSNLSAVNEMELEAMGLSHFQAIQGAQWFLDNGEAWTTLLDERPAYVFGVVDGKDTWFLGTAAYFTTGAAGIRQARALLRKVAPRYGLLRTLTRSRHPDIVRWFRVLGYTMAAEVEEGHVFLYVTNPTSSVTNRERERHKPEIVAPAF
jgi:hypothetical protein